MSANCFEGQFDTGGNFFEGFIKLGAFCFGGLLPWLFLFFDWGAYGPVDFFQWFFAAAFDRESDMILTSNGL